MTSRPPVPVLLVAAALASLEGGCPSSGSETRKTPSGRPAADRQLPFRVLELVPPRPVGLVVARRLGTAAEALRGFVQPFEEVDRYLSVEKLGRALRREIGVNLFDLGEVSDAGFDLNGDLAAFFTGRSLVFALPVADEERLDGFIAEQTRSLTTYVRSYRGTVVTTWQMGHKERGALLRIGGYLVIGLTRIGGSRKSAKRPKRLPWLDQMLAVRGGGRTVAGSPTFEWSAGALPRRNDLFGFLDVRQANRSLNRLFGRGQGGCEGTERDLEQVRRIALGAKLGQRDLQARLVVDLGSAAVAGLRAHSASGPALPTKVWEDAPARFSWRLEPGYLAGLVDRAGRRGCGALPEAIHELHWLARAVRRKPEQFRRWGGSGLAAALLAASRPRRGSGQIRAVVIVGCPGLSARRFFESAFSTTTSQRETIAGRPVFKVDHILGALTTPVRACLDDDMMRLTVGEGLMRRLLESGGAAGSRRSAGLFSLRVQPSRISDIRAVLALLARQPATPGSHQGRELDRLSAMLSRFALIRLDGELGGAGVRITAEYKLR